MSQPIIDTNTLPKMWLSDDNDLDPYQNYRFRRKPEKIIFSKNQEDFNDELSLEGINLVPWLSKNPANGKLVPEKHRSLPKGRHLDSWQKNLKKSNIYELKK